MFYSVRPTYTISCIISHFSIFNNERLHQKLEPIVVYIIATLLFIPGSLLTLGAGFVFSMALNGLGVGVLVGALSVIIGASIGAILAFLLGRYLLLEQVHKLSKKYAIFEALNATLETNGLKIFVLLRYVQKVVVLSDSRSHQNVGHSLKFTPLLVFLLGFHRLYHFRH